MIRTLCGPVRAVVPIVALLVIGCAACTPAIPGAATTPTSAAPSGIVAVDDRPERSEAWLAEFTRPNRPGCSAAAAIDGAVAWASAAGMADLDTAAALTTTTRFDLFGVSDPFIATAILLLAQDGKLALSDPLSAHVPDLPAWADQVTVDHLLHHTSGTPDIWSLLRRTSFSPSSPATQADALHLLSWTQTPNFQPGAFVGASGSDYLLLAQIVESVSVQSLPDFLRDRVFNPARLAIVPAGGTLGGVATDYAEVLGALEPALSVGHFLSGPGLLQGTPTDLARWADNYRSGTVGGPELLAAVERGAVPLGLNPGVSSYGAGIFVRVDGSLEHDGWPPGGVSYFAVSPDRHTTVDFSCNHERGRDQRDRMIAGLRQIWFGIP